MDAGRWQGPVEAKRQERAKSRAKKEKLLSNVSEKHKKNLADSNQRMKTMDRVKGVVRVGGALGAAQIARRASSSLLVRLPLAAGGGFLVAEAADRLYDRTNAKIWQDYERERDTLNRDYEARKNAEEEILEAGINAVDTVEQPHLFKNGEIGMGGAAFPMNLLCARCSAVFCGL